MKHEFKPGDLAMILAAPGAEHLVGKVVELKVAVGPGRKEIHFGSLWGNPLSEPSWIVDGQGLVSRTVRSLTGEVVCIGRRQDGLSFVRASRLMPLRGDETPDAHLATSAPRQAVTA